MVLISVVRKGTRLADQRINDVPKVDRFFVSTIEPGHDFHALAGVPQLNVVLMDPRLQSQVDILAAHRVRIAFDADHAVRLDVQIQARECGHTLMGKRRELSDFFKQLGFSFCIPRGHYFKHEFAVLNVAGKVAIATQS